MSAQWLLVGLDHGNASNRPKRRLLDRALAVAIGLIVLLLCYGVALFSLSRAWQNFEWTDFWMSAAFATLFGFLIPFARFMNIWSERRFARAQVTGQGLREIAATGNDQVVPPVAFQPMPLSLSDLPSDKPIIGPLKGLVVRPQGSQPGRTWILLLPIVIFAVFIPLFSLSLDEFDRSYSFIFDTLPFLAPVVFIGGLLLIVGLAYRGQTFSVNVDQAGFEWVTGRTRRRLAWDDVRSIFRFIPAATTGYTLSGGASWGSSAIYFIAGRDEALTWTIMPLASEQSTAASETLLRLAVTRTGKPLRDLTLLANEVATSGRSAEQFLASRYPVMPNQDNQSREGALPSNRTKARRSYASAWALTVITIILAIALLGGGLRLQNYQSSYLGNLPVHIDQQHPLFQDGFSTTDGNWPDQPLDSAHSLDGMFVADNAYHLAGTDSGNFVVALEQRQSFTDAAYEVTATESGVIPNSGYDGVGLAFRSDPSASDFLLFQVYSSGDWEFDHYRYVSSRVDDNWNFIDDGRSDAINTGVGSTNKLLVILRGQTFLLYINGHLVYSSNEHYETFADSGYAGVYLNDGSMTATFQNFAVYPVAKASLFSFGYV